MKLIIFTCAQCGEETERPRVSRASELQPPMQAAIEREERRCRECDAIAPPEHVRYTCDCETCVEARSIASLR